MISRGIQKDTGGCGEVGERGGNSINIVFMQEILKNEHLNDYNNPTHDTFT